jgi:hypothetical protein
VRVKFSAAGERLAAILYRRGVTLVHLQRAIWRGCAREPSGPFRPGRPPLGSCATPSRITPALSPRISDSQREHRAGDSAGRPGRAHILTPMPRARGPPHNRPYRPDDPKPPAPREESARSPSSHSTAS